MRDFFAHIASPDVFACWYIATLICGMGFALGYTMMSDTTIRGSKGDLKAAISRSDGGWYREIATKGYSVDVTRRSSVAFFPVYPLVASWASDVLATPIEYALLVISNLSFLASLVVFKLYLLRRYSDTPIEVREYAILAASFFPTTCFCHFAYSESTFMLVALLVLFGIQQEWSLLLLATLTGLATACRPVGIAVVAPLIVAVWTRTPRPWPRAVKVILLIPVGCWGLMAFMWFQYATFGTPLAFINAQQHWSIRPVVPFSSRIADLITLRAVFDVYAPNSPVFWQNHDSHGVAWLSLHFANPIFFLSAASLLAIGAYRRWLTVAEVSLSVAMLMIPYLTRGHEMGMGSMGRFVVVAFPIYMTLAQLASRMPASFVASFTAISAFLMGTYSALFAAGYSIY